MRAKRTISILAIIIGSLFLVIAYAAIASQTLKIMGSASATTSDANFDVKFVSYSDYGASLQEMTRSVTIDETGKSATINVSDFTTAGDAAMITFDIKNASPADVSALVSASLTNSNDVWFDVVCNWVPDGFYGEEANLIGQNETTQLQVQIILKKTPVTDADVEAAKTTINVTINAQPQ